jgi:uncharacterized membrane protein YhaH (DUF805 family)
MINLFSAKGRIRRRNYFILNLIYTVFIIPIIAISNYSDNNINFKGQLLIVLICIALLLVFIPVTIRRFHDMEYSGWFVLLLFVPLVNLGGGILLLFKDGTIGQNKYGDDPKGRIPVLTNEIDEINPKEL